MTRWIAISDTHGQHAHGPSLEVVRHFLGIWQPEQRIHLGDAFNYDHLRKGASSSEYCGDIKSDFEHGIDLLNWYKPTAFIWGNHDHRLIRAHMDSSSGERRALAGEWLEKLDKALTGAQVIDYGKSEAYKLGDHLCIHGYCTGVASTIQHARSYGNVLHGHTHDVTSIRGERIDEARGRSIGCMCDLSMDYNLGQWRTLRQQHGFAYGVIDDHGRTIVYQAEETRGIWVLPTEQRS